MARAVELLFALLAEAARASCWRRALLRAGALGLVGAVAITSILAAAGCAAAAIWLAVLPVLGPVAAPLAAAAALLLLGAGLLAAGRAALLGGAVPRSRDARPPIVGELAQLLAANRGAFLIGALLAGFAAGERSKGR